jgi:hypothetical protein
MKLETRPRGRPRNRWQDELREDGRIVAGEEWLEQVYNRENWQNGKKLPPSAHGSGIKWNPLHKTC